MGRVSTCQKNCNTIDLRRAQVNDNCSQIRIHGSYGIFIQSKQIAAS